MSASSNRDVERGFSPNENETQGLISDSSERDQDELFGLTERSTMMQVLSVLSSKATPAIVSLTLSLGGTFVNLLFAGRFVHGHLDHSVTFAGISLASMFTNVSCVSLIIGMSSAVETLCSQHNGAGNYKEVGYVLQRSCTFLALFMIPMLFVWFEIYGFCIDLGTDADVCMVLRNFIWIRALSVPVDVVNYSYEKYLMSLGVMEVSMYANLLFNFCVLVFDCIFVFGFGGGYESLAWSWVLSTYIAASYQYTGSLAHIEVRRTLQAYDMKQAFSKWGEYIYLGVPGTIMMCSEWWAFEFLVLMSSFLGTAAVAAQSIIIQIAAISFMAPLGIGITVASFVGNAIGAGRPGLGKRVGRIGLIFSFACSALTGLLIYTGGPQFVGLYTTDPDIRRIALEATPFLSLFVIMDGQQAVASGVLRGAGKQRIGAVANVIAFYALGLPMAYYVCFNLGWGVDGLIIGISSGSVLQLLVLYSALFVYENRIFDHMAIQSPTESNINESGRLLEGNSQDSRGYFELTNPNGSSLVRESKDPSPTASTVSSKMSSNYGSTDISLKNNPK